ncbi:MAG: ABC transporter ATP-binding protein [Nitrospirae bacterium]|nr:MAG: ABC transporter ATP-binding protein [Nitrospirota bacterium]
MESELVGSVRLDRVVKWHGPHCVLDAVSLEVKQGEFFSILGPSGSGKTTLLRIIAGFDRPNAGRVLIQEQPLDDLPPHQRPVNMVFQHYALFPHLSVWKNVAFGLERRRIARAEVIRRVTEALHMVRLETKGNRFPHELSGGEQQRVALARALVNRPQVLLLDEPLGALDQQLRQAMQGELKRIQEQVGITFICVTHHQEEALSMSDRVAVIDQGRVLQIGSPHELYESPASMAVAQFIGLSNCLHGEVVCTNGTLCTFQVPELGTFLVPKPHGRLPQGTATFMLRPERIRLLREPSSSHGENMLAATVQTVRYSGGELQYQIALSPHIVWTARLPIESKWYEPFHPGERLTVSWDTHEGLILAS